MLYGEGLCFDPAHGLGVGEGRCDVNLRRTYLFACKVEESRNVTATSNALDNDAALGLKVPPVLTPLLLGQLLLTAALAET